MQLKKRGQLDVSITESGSMDWRAEENGLEETIERLGMQPSFMPRPGEVVLWTTAFEGELSWNAEHECVEIYSSTKKCWMGRPEWRAGVIGQVPEQEIILQDLVDMSRKKWDISYCGFRVETLPDPNGLDKSYSLHYKYVHLKCIKPFNAYENFLQGIPRDELHPSIEYAMTIMSSFSLLNKYRFKGVWPNASIFCKGIFIGAELLLVGDAVRLKPTFPYGPEDAYRAVMDVMIIDEIRLELADCVEDPTSDQLAGRYDVRISGKVYTKNYQRTKMDESHPPPKALKADEVTGVFRSIGMSGYGDWYPLWSRMRVTVSQNMVIGRCYEPDAMQFLFSSLHLGLDLCGVLNGREYSRKVDERIPQDKDWFWGDFRTQTLAIDTLNGEDVGYYSDTRDVKLWRANLRIVDGTATQADFRQAKIPGDVGRPATKSATTFGAVGKISKLVSTGLGDVDISNPVSSAEEEGVKEESSSNDDDDEEEEEEVFVARIDQLRGGTEESEEGDYAPVTDINKRPKYEY
ncbi:hypothetical protein FE257_006805 [Aspergillus nanangensis]|uniref:Cryptic loci regulator 2 C-terminal domain-containing protein n=1 Tax=Aspergillus nanangensis TaxID=2582783 RepID=A0AAD4GUP2_ASPNN|nr:hypothetical protein FE257_006805 [Aspergillus nanangensis]